ncbi:hypothetical protein DBV15_09930 [Temnothorax longispinosus]|uniref:Uncharacterized protein n=1 Tax=Temnothorax longispinosus TaxID=300112 RepID=A0A4S2KIA8_9HYME|nr:hypothetical protein DBV15_09930 [Temnothorax longispinosus]
MRQTEPSEKAIGLRRRRIGNGCGAAVMGKGENILDSREGYRVKRKPARRQIDRVCVPASTKETKMVVTRSFRSQYAEEFLTNGKFSF